MHRCVTRPAKRQQSGQNLLAPTRERQHSCTTYRPNLRNGRGRRRSPRMAGAGSPPHDHAPHALGAACAPESNKLGRSWPNVSVKRRSPCTKPRERFLKPSSVQPRMAIITRWLSVGDLRNEDPYGGNDRCACRGPPAPPQERQNARRQRREPPPLDITPSANRNRGPRRLMKHGPASSHATAIQHFPPPRTDRPAENIVLKRTPASRRIGGANEAASDR